MDEWILMKGWMAGWAGQQTDRQTDRPIRQTDIILAYTTAAFVK
jgi:hypothetical protein